VPNRLFWKIGLLYLLLFSLVMFAVDFLAARALRQVALDSAFLQLEALGRLVVAQPPPRDEPALAAWMKWAATSGARITVIAQDGKVLAESAREPEGMENHANRPEVLAAMESGHGRAVRRSATLQLEIVYFAVRYNPPQGAPQILRVALPLSEVQDVKTQVRNQLWAASALILIVVVAISFIFSQGLAQRVERLKQYSQQVALGDFRALPADSAGDELSDLARTLSGTAAHLESTVRTLTDERNFSGAVLGSMTEGVAVVDAGCRVVYANPAFAGVVGATIAECTGRPLVEVARQPQLVAAVQQVLREGGVVHIEIEFGTGRPRNFNAAAARIEADAAPGAVLVLHDVSETRRLERVRRDFVANVSHELRTPLTAVQGFAETLLGGALEDPKSSRRFLEIIRAHAARLSRLTDDLLKLSAIEAGKLTLHMLPVRVASLFEACLETARQTATGKKIELRTEAAADLPAMRGDAMRLQEVLQNLLDNALQYTPAGGCITVKAWREDRAVVMSVEDTGIGIPHGEQERIFERFYRVDIARSRDAGGTGLGLSIARHIVEAHDGHIRVESEVGKGSRFFVSIPEWDG
jgi:two-component system phosphate regulon sensor histidine kinase PhoR